MGIFTRNLSSEQTVDMTFCYIKCFKNLEENDNYHFEVNYIMKFLHNTGHYQQIGRSDLLSSEYQEYNEMFPFTPKYEYMEIKRFLQGKTSLRLELDPDSLDRVEKETLRDCGAKIYRRKKKFPVSSILQEV